MGVGTGRTRSDGVRMGQTRSDGGGHGTDTLRWGSARDGHAQIGGRCQTQSYGSQRGNNQIGIMTDISKTGYMVLY